MSRLALILLPLFTGCIEPKTSDTTGGGDEGGGDDTGSSSGSMSIYDIQTGAVEDGELAALTGVVITTSITADGKGFFIQDEGGGEYSGIYVYLQGSFTDFKVYPGDRVNITGEVSEYYDFTELTVTSPAAVEVTGEATVVADELTGTESWSAEDWEPWESGLVTLPDQTVTSALNNYGEAELSGGIVMDNMFYDFDTEFGATYDAVTGAIAYGFGEFKLSPRDDDDLEGYTPGEGPSTATLCEIQEAQVEGTMTDMPVVVEGVIVTSGLEGGGAGFYAQDEGGGAWCGAYIFTDWADLDESYTLDVGDVVSFEAAVTEYYDLTELTITEGDTLVATGSGADVYAESLTSIPEDWEPYEGVLVTLTDVTVTSDSSSYGEADTDWDIQIDDTLFGDTLDFAEGAFIESLTGIVSYSYSTWEILPRSADDLTGYTGGTGGGDPDNVTVAEIQQGLDDGTMSEGDDVIVEGVVATSGLDVAGKGFYVQDAGGGAWSGVYVYLGSITGVEVEVGDVLTIAGELDEYYDFTELKVSSADDVSITGSGTPVATAISAAPSDWEPYEGCLLEVADVEVLTDPDSYSEAETNYGFYLNDSLYAYDAAEGDSFSSVTGLLDYSFSKWLLETRDASDFVE